MHAYKYVCMYMHSCACVRLYIYVGLLIYEHTYNVCIRMHVFVYIGLYAGYVRNYVYIYV